MTNENNKNNKKLSAKPYKGARDFYPKDMVFRNYIFDLWRQTAKSFGFCEYDAPLLEKWDIYAAKTGEEIVNNQLYCFEDQAGRKIAIRPEKTPSLARMVAAKVKELPKPIRWFNIGNCWRYEKPQKGRGREFYQFDCDILGEDSTIADAEVFSIPIEVMKKLGATEKMFEIRVCNRKLAEFYLKDEVKLTGGISDTNTQMYNVAKIIDSKPKITEEKFEKQLKEEDLDANQITKLNSFINSDLSFLEQYKNRCGGAKELLSFFKLMENKGYKKYLKYSPEIMRGLDYYTGNVIEQFDLNPENNRSMYGGGRYDNLVSLFSSENISGVGFAMGDITLLEFLKDWDLLPKLKSDVDFMIVRWPADQNKKDITRYDNVIQKVARKLRSKNKNVEVWLDNNSSLNKQLEYANKQNIPNVVIIGEDELENNTVTIKNMVTGDQKTKNVEKL